MSCCSKVWWYVFIWCLGKLVEVTFPILLATTMPLSVNYVNSGEYKIPIPPKLPEILKQFTKAAIRTQPRDVLQWSAAYFSALANEQRPPVKERIEFVSKDSASWITLGLLRVLHRQLGSKEYVLASQIKRNWDGLCLDPKKFVDVIQLGNFTSRILWIGFLATVCKLATQNQTVHALHLFCEVITEEPEGCTAKVPFKIFSQAYKIISGDQEVSSSFLQYLMDCSECQGGFVHPGNFRSPLGPEVK